ncbi:MAG: response regulator [Candidatus Sericytochromatia bacterium]
MGIYNELINAFVWVKISCVPILDVNKKPYMVYILFEDITESRAIQIELIKEKKRVEEANKVKNEFLNNMSHELRTPLNGIMGFSDLLLKTNLTNEQKDYIKAISNSSNALLDLINDILNFSKIETGNIQLDIVKTNLLETCEQLIDILSYKAIEKSLDLYLNFSPLLPEYVWMDVVKFKQIMLNLLGNAIKFTNEGEIHIYVSCIKEDIDKARITFSITDTGIGISELNRKKIFDAFSQEDGSSTRKHGGTGLGLTISNKLLELMDSKLDFKTQLEQGSSFYFTLDLKSEFSNAHNFINSNINNILIIDKNQENKGIIQNIFYDISPNITFISDSFDLISNIDFKKYDLLIIEHRIRSFNSIEIIDRIRNELNIPDEKLKIVLLYSPLDIGILNNQEKGLIFTKIQKPIKHSYFNLNLLNTTCETINKGYLDLKDVYKKVLVAEDNPINMLLTKKILKSLFPQVEIIEARNGREAVKLFASNKPDIVYMDLQMPEMNGYEATTEIRKTEFHKNTPIIALTADVIEGTREACLEKGMNDYISKPVIMEIIKESYIKWINRGIIP